MKYYRKVALLFAGLFFSCNSALFSHEITSTHSPKQIEFVANKGQWHENVLFKAKINNGAIFVEQGCITYVVCNQAQLDRFRENKFPASYKKSPYNGKVDISSYRMHIVGANTRSLISGIDKASHYHNYFLGNDPARWTSEVAIFKGVRYENIYPGIDLLLDEKDAHFKYEFIVNEQVSPDIIQLEYSGIKSLSLSGGDLIVTTEAEKITERTPRAYQISATGDTMEVDCRYKVKKRKITFDIGKYDKTLKLVIDPTLVFSSYSGSISDNWGFTATYDLHGNLYGGGIANDFGYPTVDTSFQTDFAGGDAAGWDITISKFDETGYSLYYSTYLGGTYPDMPHSLVVNDNDELYVLGTSGSPDFPVTLGAINTIFQGGLPVKISNDIRFILGSDIIISKFNNTGTKLLASTFIGGTDNDGLNRDVNLRYNYADEIRGEIILDQQSNVYITSSTESADFPVTSGAFQPLYGMGGQDAIVMKIDQSLSSIIWSSFLGGRGADAGYSVVLAKDESIYICGGTNSEDFPVTPQALKKTFDKTNAKNSADGFITHIDPSGTTILHSTYLGTDYYDQSYLIKNDRFDHPHVFGQTEARGDVWIKNANWYTLGGGQFITKLSPSLDSIIWSTAFGSGRDFFPDIVPTALLVDLCNSIYLSGWGSPLTNLLGGTAGLPITPDAYQKTTDDNDYYFLCLKDDASALIYATYFGSPMPQAREHVDGGTSRFDKKGRIYQAVCAGCGGYSNFPTTPGAWSNTNNSYNCNLGVIKMDFNLPVVIADFMMPSTVCAPSNIKFSNRSQTISTNTLFNWDFGDGTTSDEHSPEHLYGKEGIYTVCLIVTDTGSCNFGDTLCRQLLVLNNTLDTLPTVLICDSIPLQIGIFPSGNESITYNWYPPEGLSNPNISNPMAFPDSSTCYFLYVSNGMCTDTLRQEVGIDFIDIAYLKDTIVCQGETVELKPLVNRKDSYLYSWSEYPDFSILLNNDPTTPDITLSPTETTTYYFKVKSPICERSTKVTVFVSAIHVEIPTPPVVCFDDSIAIRANSDCRNCTYQWEAAPSILTSLDADHIWVKPTGNTTYRLTVTNQIGCTVASEVEVIKQTATFPYPFSAWSDEREVMYKTTTQVHATLYPDGHYTYQWSPAAGMETPTQATSTITLLQTTIYHVTARDHFGCEKGDTVLITVKPIICDEPYIYLPNAFTPNGDQVNDMLYVRGVFIDRISLQVYNSWGKKVFETKDMNIGWDGTYNGTNAPAGVYDYYLEVYCLDHQKFTKKGNITLIR